MRLDRLAELLGAVLEGEGSADVTGMAGLEEATAAEVSFLANPRYASQMATTRAGAVLVAGDWQGQHQCALLRVKQPDAAFAEVATLIGPPPVALEPGVHPSAVVAASATLGEGVCVGPCAVVAPGARIGARTVVGAGCYVGHESVIGCDGLLHPGAIVRERVTIGDRVILQCGAVIGSDGFGYVPTAEGWKKVPQVGVVVLGNDVEIGANTTIDRARFGKTVIEDGVKLDNLVQIAHNCRIGRHTAMAAQVGIAGSTTVGARGQWGGQSGAAGHVSVGDHVFVGGRAGVIKDIAAPGFYSGFPAQPHAEDFKQQATLRRLPALREKLRALEERIRQLEEKAAT